MKITLYDPNCYKFTDDMILHWESQGHETRKTLYYDPMLAIWADVVWFETCDNNLHQATTQVVNGETAESVGLKDKKVICRVIDIEAWCGLHIQVDWSYVDETIFVAPHIRDLVLKDMNVGKHQVIPCGVNTDKFTFKKEFSTQPRKIAWVAERWHAKGIDLALQLLLALPNEYKIYAVGIWAIEPWYKAYVDYFIKQNHLEDRFIVIEHTPDMNEFLEGMDFALCCSKKEAFSYAIAEGMSKGLKPLIHNFYGADKIWDKKYIWNSVGQCVDMIMGNYNPPEYRDYVVGNYSKDMMLSKFDKIINNIKEIKNEKK